MYVILFDGISQFCFHTLLGVIVFPDMYVCVCVCTCVLCMCSQVGQDSYWFGEEYEYLGEPVFAPRSSSTSRDVRTKSSGLAFV